MRGIAWWRSQFNKNKHGLFTGKSSRRVLLVARWAGPILAMSMSVGKVAGQKVLVRTLQWPGLFGWEPRNWKNDGVPNNEAVFLGFLTNVGMDVGPIGLTYSGLNFLNERWNTLLGVSYTGSVTGSVTRNVNKEKWLFYVGLTWKPEQK